MQSPLEEPFICSVSCRKNNIEQNVVTYNTMIEIHEQTLNYEKATKLIQGMQERAIGILAKAGNVEEASWPFWEGKIYSYF